LENHRTDTQYEDSLILKQFVFQFVNSYASFFFLAFIAQNLEKPDNLPAGEGDDYVGQCGYKNCMQPLSINLAIIFGTRLVLNNTLDLVIPWYNALQKRKAETKDISIDTKLSPPEEDYILMQFNDKVGNIENYADAAIQFGFSTLFVSALPIAPFLSLVANYVRAKVIAWKLLKVSTVFTVLYYLLSPLRHGSLVSLCFSFCRFSPLFPPSHHSSVTCLTISPLFHLSHLRSINVLSQLVLKILDHGYLFSKFFPLSL
jgi:hypothetical protein